MSAILSRSQYLHAMRPEQNVNDLTSSSDRRQVSTHQVQLGNIDITVTSQWAQWRLEFTGVSTVCSTVCSGTDQRKHQRSPSLAFVRRIHRSPVDSHHKGPVTQQMFYLVTSSWTKVAAAIWCHHAARNNKKKKLWMCHLSGCVNWWLFYFHSCISTSEAVSLPSVPSRPEKTPVKMSNPKAAPCKTETHTETYKKPEENHPLPSTPCTYETHTKPMESHPLPSGPCTYETHTETHPLPSEPCKTETHTKPMKK